MLFPLQLKHGGFLSGLIVVPISEKNNVSLVDTYMHIEIVRYERTDSGYIPFAYSYTCTDTYVCTCIFGNNN